MPFTMLFFYYFDIIIAEGSVGSSKQWYYVENTLVNSVQCKHGGARERERDYTLLISTEHNGNRTTRWLSSNI